MTDLAQRARELCPNEASEHAMELGRCDSCARILAVLKEVEREAKASTCETCEAERDRLLVAMRSVEAICGGVLHIEAVEESELAATLPQIAADALREAKEEATRVARERCVKSIEDSQLTEVHIGPLFNAGWSEALKYLARRLGEGD
jgi:hypothetical protein